MTAAPPCCRTPARLRGFSLLEILVTLTLACALALLVLPGLAPGASGVELSADARVLASRLRAAREIALATRQNTAVTLDLVTPGLRGPAADTSYRLRAVEAILVRTAKGMASSGQVVIAFMPDGTSTGGDITLLHGSQRRLVRVAWLTGQVSIGGAP